VEFAGKVLVQVVLCAASGFMEGVVVYLVNSRMRLVSDVRGVSSGGGTFEKLRP